MSYIELYRSLLENASEKITLNGRVFALEWTDDRNSPRTFAAGVATDHAGARHAGTHSRPRPVPDPNARSHAAGASRGDGAGRGGATAGDVRENAGRLRPGGRGRQCRPGPQDPCRVRCPESTVDPFCGSQSATHFVRLMTSTASGSSSTTIRWRHL